MIVFYAPKYIDFLFIKALAASGLLIHVVDKNDVIKNTFLKKFQNIKKVKLESEDKIGICKKIDYPPEHIIRNYLSSLQIVDVYQNLSAVYQGISFIEEKLNLSLVSSLGYHSAGLVYAYYITNYEKKFEKLYIINCDFRSFLLQEYKIFDNKSVHVFFPLGYLVGLPHYLFKALMRLLKFLKNIQKRSVLRPRKKSKGGKAVAVFFHKSDTYGGLYKKAHYFSSDKTSILHWENVIKYVLYPDDHTPNYLIPVSSNIQKTDFFGIFNVISFFSFLRLGQSEKRAVLILFLRYLEYKSWLRTFQNSTLRYVIVDYDILFPKPLSLALEKLGIPTFSIQERPTSSLYHKIYGVICDVYGYSGELWREHGEKNRSIICKRSVNFGSWRHSFFKNENLKFENMVFHRRVSLSVSRKKIIFFGYFLDPESPVANSGANEQFFDYVEAVSARFAECDLFVRMKDLNEVLYQRMYNRFSGLNNVYISTQYDVDGLSYSLCNAGDAIVSVQTSLAEEALSYGKKVVLLDNLYTVNSMCSDIYPSEFDFLIARTADDIFRLIDGIFLADQTLMRRYKRLQKALSADQVFASQSEVASTIERVLLTVCEKQGCNV